MRGPRIGLCHGCFDVLHAGHIRHLTKASELVDLLFVSVTADDYVNKGPGRPINTLGDRMAVLKALKVVFSVIPSYESTACKSINEIKPDLYIKGNEYNEGIDPTGRLDLEREAVEKHGGKLVFTEELKDSSTRIINSLKLERAFERIKGLNVLVIGDTILDGTTEQHGELHHIIVNLDNVKWHHGGAAIYAKHAMGLGCIVKLETFDPPVRKVRFTDGSRVDITNKVNHNKIITYGHNVVDPEVVILSDFGYCGPFVNLERLERAKVVAWNAQKNKANARDLVDYWDQVNRLGHHISLITMNQYEWNEVKDTPPKCGILVVTRQDGADVIGGPSYTYSMPSKQVVDTTGCGDAFTTMMACSLGAGIKLEDALQLGCLAGATTATWELNTGVICPQNLIKMAKELKQL